jgi:hypothetical protein
MIRPLLSRFRREPLTPESARDRIAAEMDKAVKDGLQGFCLAALSQPGTHDAQVTIICKGDIQESLAKVLQLLLTGPESKNATTMAIIAAIQASGGGRVVQMVPVGGDDNCDCPICTAGRAARGMAPPSKPH